MSSPETTAKSKSRSRLIKVIAIEAAVALVIFIWAVASRGTTEAAPDPTPSGPVQSGNLVAGCEGVISVKTPVPSYSAPEQMPEDDREHWVLQTNCGEIVIKVLENKAPQTVNSMKFLTSKGFFDNTPCHRLTTANLFVFQCGDPAGSGMSNAGYTLPEENLPTGGGVTYPRGTVAMARSSEPNSSGSQFFLVYQDTTLGPNYTIFGKVVQGGGILEAVATAGTLGAKPDGVPAQSFGIIKATFETR